MKLPLLGGVVSLSFLLGLVELLKSGLKQLAIRKEGLEFKLLLVLLPGPVVGFLVPHHMWQNHYLQGLLSLLVGELAVIEKVGYSGAQDIYALILELFDILEELVSNVPEIIFSFDGH